MVNTPYAKFQVTGSYTDVGDLYGYQLVHVGCESPTSWTKVESFIGSTTLEHLRQIADEHWASRRHAGQALPSIPAGKYRFRREPPKFVRMKEFADDWLLLGMDEDLIPGKDTTLTRYGTGDPVTVRVSEVLAERVVKHRADSYGGPGETRFVLVTFESLVEEPIDEYEGPRG